jgi:hypothetical protein
VLIPDFKIGLIAISSDFGMNWGEESVNLGLFEELSEIEYTPPASPKKTLQPHHQLSEHSVADFSSVEQLPLPPTDLAAVSALTAEFQAILESLPKDTPIDTIMDIGGIPTTVIDGEALVPVEIDLSLISVQDLKDLNIDIEDVRLQAINEEEMELIDESDTMNLVDVSNVNSPAPSSIYSINEDIMVEVEDEEDRLANKAEKILDALLIGDVSTAHSYVTISDDSSMSSNSSQSSGSGSYIEEVKAPQSKATSSTVSKKPERR